MNTANPHYSIEMANRSLPLVSVIAGDIADQYARIIRLRKRQSNTHLRDADYETAMDRLGELVNELHPLGVELRDFEAGTLAFPSEFCGRRVFLSWKPGESTVCHWHECDESVGCRRPLPSPSSLNPGDPHA